MVRIKRITLLLWPHFNCYYMSLLIIDKVTTKILILTAICLFDDFATTSLLSISALTNLSLSLSRSLSGFSRTELDLRPDDFCLSVLSWLTPSWSVTWWLCWWCWCCCWWWWWWWWWWCRWWGWGLDPTGSPEAFGSVPPQLQSFCLRDYRY